MPRQTGLWPVRGTYTNQDRLVEHRCPGTPRNKWARMEHRKRISNSLWLSKVVIQITVRAVNTGGSRDFSVTYVFIVPNLNYAAYFKPVFIGDIVINVGKGCNFLFNLSAFSTHIYWVSSILPAPDSHTKQSTLQDSSGGTTRMTCKSGERLPVAFSVMPATFLLLPAVTGAPWNILRSSRHLWF